MNGGIISMGSGALSMTGTVPVSGGTSNGVLLASTNITTTGAITLLGTSNSAGNNSYGTSLTVAFVANSPALLSITGTGGSGMSSHGVNIGADLSNIGPITITGIAGAGANSFGNFLDPNITTSGSVITIVGTTLLDTNTLLDSTNGGAVPTGANIIFSGSGSTIDASASGVQNLDIRAGTNGSVTFGGAIGSITRLGSLNIISAQTSSNAINIGSNITSTAFTISTVSPVTLTGSSAIDATPGAISFPSTISGTTSGGQNLTLITTLGTISFANNIGSASVPLGNILISSGAGLTFDTTINSINATSFTVAGAIPTTLNATGSTLTVDTSSGNGAIEFGGAVNGSRNLTLTAGSGSITFSGIVGGSTPIGALTVATTNVASGGFNINANINAASLLATSVTRTTLTSASTITTTNAITGVNFGSTIDGAFPFAIAAGAGPITLSGAIGSIAPLSSLTTTTTGSTVFGSTIETSGASGIQANGAAVSFNGNVTTTGTGPVAIVNSGLLTIPSGVTFNLDGSFTQTGSGNVSFGGTVNTSNDNISFLSPISLTANATLNSGSGATISIGSTVDGSFGFTIGAGSGSVLFQAPVGVSAPLSSLSVTAATIATQGNHIVSTGPMTYTGAVSISTNTSFINGGLLGGLVFNGSITGNFPLNIDGGYSTVSITGDDDTSAPLVMGPLGSHGGQISISSDLSVTLGGEILSQGGTAVTGTGGDGGSVSISSNDGSVSIHNVNTSGGGGTVTGGNGGNITISPSSVTTSGFPDGLIILNEDLSSGVDGNLVARGGAAVTPGTGGTILLSANRGVATKVATIVSSLAGNDVLIFGDRLIIGNHEAVTVLGDLSMNIDTSITLSDTVVLENLSFTTGTVFLLTHGSFQILSSFGTLYTTPSLHLLSGGLYSPTGEFIPSGPVNAFSLGLSPSDFRSLLLFGSTILNYDTTAPITPPVTVFVSLVPFQYAFYQLAVATAEMSDKLPIFEIFPYPSPNICRQNKHAKQCRFPEDPDVQEFRRWNFGYRDVIRPEY